MVKPVSLFNSRTIKKFCAKVDVTNAQKKAAKEWLSLLENNKLEEEKPNYPVFMKIILEEILGYPIKEVQFERDNVEFQFSNSLGKKIVCFEAKGTATKDLFSSQHRDKKEHETPIKQTWDYVGKNDLDYGICTNYKDFVLIDRSKGYSKCHFFDFTLIRNDEEKLKEFVAVFSKKSIIDNKFVEDLYHKSVIEEREFTKEFYKLFHETRLMLIKEFKSNGNTKDESIHYAQLYLNRLIFMFFAEDNENIPKRIFPERVLEILKSPLITEHSKLVSDTIVALFESLDKGSTMLNIFGFNGGLFQDPIPPKIYFNDIKDPAFFNDVYQHSDLKKEIKLDEDSSSIIKKYHGKLNPIISNLLIMDSFDFNTEVNVNILGHIFEQSLTDLEELKGHEISKRKKDGIFYTPEYVTDYICRHTIIPYLSKNGSTNVDDLIKEYSDDIGELEKKFKEIKILDPACGSGAFLLKAVDILLEIHKEIQTYKESGGQYTFFRKGKKSSGLSEQFTLAKWHEEDEARKIIEKNIFGVDINEESVEITKLSLFLKIATTNRKLINLSENIKVGDSLIDDKLISGDKALNWKSEFKEIMDAGGFDVVIGNPPYLRIQGLHESHGHTTEYLEKQYSSATGRYDYYVLFVERGSKLLQKNGYLGFILPHKFTTTQFGHGFRKYLSDTKLMHSFLSFGHNFVFAEAATYTGILILKNMQNNNFLYKEIGDLKTKSIEVDVGLLKPEDFQILDQKNFNENPWMFASGAMSTIIDKITMSGPEISEYFERILQGVVTGDNSLYYLQPIRDKGSTMILFSTKANKEVEIEKMMLKPLVTGGDIKKYVPLTESRYFILYPYVVENGKQRPLEENELKKNFPLSYEYLLQFKDYLINLRTKLKTNPKYWYGLHNSRKLEWFEQEKIVTAQITLGCNMSLDKQTFVHNEQVYSFIRKPNLRLDNRYFLAILNSKLMWYFIKNTGVVLRGGYFRFKTKYLEPFHIPNSPDVEIEKELIKHVESILNLNIDFKEKQSKFENRVKSYFKIQKLSKKIERFYNFSFDSFISEIVRLGGLKLQLKEQDEWEDYFESYRKNLIQLKTEIEKIDYKINHLVYKLYCLNDDEIKIVEDVYPKT